MMNILKMFSERGLVPPGVDFAQRAKDSGLLPSGKGYADSFRPSDRTSKLIRTTAVYSKQDYLRLAEPLKQNPVEFNKLTAIYEGRYGFFVCFVHSIYLFEGLRFLLWKWET